MNSFRPTQTEVLALIDAAVAAPSADNCHHVVFEIHETRIVLRTDGFYAKCIDPVRRCLTEMSYGAIAENIRVWLAARGLSFRPRWFPAPDDPGLLLSVVWDELAEAAADPGLAAHIATRHTNRKFFHGPPLSASERAAIDGACAGQADMQLDWFEEPPRRAALLRLIRRAEAERFRHPRHHADLFDSIAFDVGWSATSRERIAPGSLEVEAPLRGLFKALRRWPAMRVANRFGAATLLGLRAGDLPARLSPHVLALVSRLPPREAALEGGALFERVWLVAESLGLALQPMAASAVLRHDRQLDAGDQLDLTGAWRDLSGNAWSPVLVFRLGRASRPRVRSSRKPGEDYRS